MKIVADENIPFASEAFSGLGEVVLGPGRDLPDITDADALIVRSITKVNADLLEGTSVKFVGTSTIGFDHIDREYLASHGIGFSSAPGSNSNSVAEYIVASILEYSAREKALLEGRSIAVVGVGNVGSKVVAKCEALGMNVLKCDPPLANETGDQSYRPLEEVLGADFVTLHVPLTKEGPYSTWHMADAEFFGGMNGVFLNSSRGRVVDESALKQALGGTVKAAMLDVWETEPDVDRELAARVAGTPHIAGYSFDGKVNGTQMMYNAVCRHFGIEPAWNAADVLPPAGEIIVGDGADEDVLREAVRQVYDIRNDYSAFVEHLDEFDRLRKEYPRRREFQTVDVNFSGSNSAVAKLDGIGFRLG